VSGVAAAEHMSEPKFARSAAEPTCAAEPEREVNAPRPEYPDRPERTDRPARNGRSDFGPPPGYQPILLPGESISKYKRLAESQPRAEKSAPQGSDTPPIAAAFPEDEPLFAQPESDETATLSKIHGKAIGPAANAEVGSTEWDREQKRLHEMNVATVFGEIEAHKPQNAADDRMAAMPEHPTQTSMPLATVGSMEEEEIEEEEAELSSYAEGIEEEDEKQESFEEEELVEETHSAADHHGLEAREIAASGELIVTNAAAPSFVIEGGMDEPQAEGEVDEVTAEQEEKGICGS